MSLRVPEISNAIWLPQVCSKVTSVLKSTVSGPRRFTFSSQNSCGSHVQNAMAPWYASDEQEAITVICIKSCFRDGLLCNFAMHAENIELRDGVRCVISTLWPYDLLKTSKALEMPAG